MFYYRFARETNIGENIFSDATKIYSLRLLDCLSLRLRESDVDASVKQVVK